MNPYINRWEEQAKMLVNRVRKNKRHLRKWAKREGIHCYRLYDSDIPEIPMAIDWYEGRLHVSEYKKNLKHPEEIHEYFLHIVLDALIEELDADESDVFLKRRQRQRGVQQYERFSSEGFETVVEERGLNFKVNLSDYLDTGLFLDHRPTRQRVREEAEGKRCLNLFAYTGAFSVYAAAGGAEHVTTVDLSNTYLDWAKENFELNNLPLDSHRFLASDTFEFLRDPQRREEPRYDLVIVDPPTFSNSKKFAGVFDIQRDHVSLLQKVLRCTKYGGVVYFSTNYRKFKLDTEALECEHIEEITHQSVPKDFRNKKIHRCWRLVC